jgi:hypothetical protein
MPLRLVRLQIRQCQHFARRAVGQVIVRSLCRLWQVPSRRKPVLQVWAYIPVDTSRDFWFFFFRFRYITYISRYVSNNPRVSLCWHVQFDVWWMVFEKLNKVCFFNVRSCTYAQNVMSPCNYLCKLLITFNQILRLLWHWNALGHTYVHIYIHTHWFTLCLAQWSIFFLFVTRNLGRKITDVAGYSPDLYCVCSLLSGAAVVLCIDNS